MLLYFLLAVLLRRPLELVYHSAMSANAEVQTCLKESLQGLELIKTYNIGNQLRMRLMEKHKRFLDKCYKREMLGSFGSSGSILIEQVSNLIIIFIGFEFVSNGRLSLGELMTFFMMQAIMNDSAKELLYLQQSFRNGVVAADRLNDVVGMKDESKDGLPIGTIHEIRVEDLGFYYFGGPELFQHISFSIKNKKSLR